jgi:hypothetical protein
MTATEIAVRRPEPQPGTIPAKLAYARALADSGLLPASYRKNPANVLWAAEYAEMLGLPIMAALTGVHVIDGKPTASAGLISGLVRKAKHRLRVTGDDKHAIAEIVRCDDPKFTFRSEWTLDRAKQAELLGKTNWKKYPAAMLKARAITEAARDACEEALFGLHYTAEELGAEVDEDGVVVGAEAGEDTWENSDPEPPCQDEQPNGNGTRQRWADTAIAQAASLKSEAEGQKLWRESAAAVLDSRCTPGEATHIQNIITARVADRRTEAARRILKPLPDDDPWRLKILDELGSDDDAREAVAELGRLKAAGTMDEERAGLIARAVIARFPKAAITEGGSDG